jgi:probable addiction module antidote protein
LVDVTIPAAREELTPQPPFGACKDVANKLQCPNSKYSTTSLRLGATRLAIGSTNCVIAKRLRRSCCDWDAYGEGCSVTANRWEVVCGNYGWMLARATAFITRGQANQSFCCYVAATRGDNMTTLRKRGVTGPHIRAPRVRVKAHADYLWRKLANDDHATALLKAAFAGGDEGDIMYALREIAMAKVGIAEVAESTGLSRETLYRTLSRTGNPRLSTLLAVMRAAKVKLKVESVG